MKPVLAMALALALVSPSGAATSVGTAQDGPPTSWIVEPHPAIDAARGQGECQAIDVPDETRAVLRCVRPGGSAVNVVTHGRALVPLLSTTMEGAALREIEPQRVNAHGDVAGTALLDDGSRVAVAWTAKGARFTRMPSDWSSGLLEVVHLTNSGLVVLSMDRRLSTVSGTCHSLWDAPHGLVPSGCGEGLRPGSTSNPCRMVSLADDGSAVQYCAGYKSPSWYAFHPRQPLAMGRPGGTATREWLAVSRSGGWAVARTQTHAQSTVLSVTSAAGARHLPGTAWVGEEPVQIGDDGVIRTETSLLVPGVANTGRVPVRDWVRRISGAPQASLLTYHSPRSVVFSTVPVTRGRGALPPVPVPVGSLRVLHSPTPLVDAATPLLPPAPDQPLFRWSAVPGLEGEKACAPWRHTRGGSMVAQCEGGAVALTPQGRREMNCPPYHGRPPTPGLYLYDITDTGWVLGSCGRKAVRWAPHQAVPHVIAEVWNDRLYPPRITPEGVAAVPDTDHHGNDWIGLLRAPTPDAPSGSQAALTPDSTQLSDWGLAVASIAGAPFLYDGVTRIPLQGVPGRRYRGVGVSPDGLRVLGLDVTTEQGFHPVWLFRDRPPEPAVLPGLESLRYVKAVTSSGWVATDQWVCPPSGRCVPWEQAIAGLSAGSAVRVVDLLDDGTALAVIGGDASGTVVLLTPVSAG